MGKFAFLFAVILSVSPLTIAHSEELEMPPERLRNQTEWFSLRAMAGNYGGGIEASLFTLRYRYFVWEILRGGGSLGGPGFGKGIHSSAQAAYGGTALGLQFPLGPTARHEVRIETGIFGGMMQQNTKWPDFDYYDVAAGYYSPGPFVLLEASYVHHISEHFALQTGIEALVPTLKIRGGFDGDDGHDGTNYGLPDAMLMAFVGIRIGDAL